MSSFQFGSDQPQNKGTYGFPLPPNAQTRVAPPEWKNANLITATTSTEVVPQNVYQIGVAVFGGGGGGAGDDGSSGANARGGGGGGFAFGIVDVVPGQLLPTITIGAAGTAGSNSVGGGWWHILIWHSANSNRRVWRY